MSASGSPRLALLALALLSLIWGYNWVVMKQVIQYVDPFDFSAIRTVLGAATLFVVLLVLRRPLGLQQVRQVALLGVLQGFDRALALLLKCLVLLGPLGVQLLQYLLKVVGTVDGGGGQRPGNVHERPH